MDLVTPWEEWKGHGKSKAQQMDLAIPSDHPWAIEIPMAEQMDLERWKELLTDLEIPSEESKGHEISKAQQKDRSTT